MSTIVVGIQRDHGIADTTRWPSRANLRETPAPRCSPSARTRSTTTRRRTTTPRCASRSVRRPSRRWSGSASHSAPSPQCDSSPSPIGPRRGHCSRPPRSADAALIVIGSSHTGFSGHVQPGSTAVRLFHGAPCAPSHSRLRIPRPHLTERRVTVAFDGSTAARNASGRSGRVRACRRGLAARGHGLRARHRTAPVAAQPTRLRAPHGRRRAIGSGASSSARSRRSREPRPAFLIGDPATELARESEVSDLLVVGSRGYGPVASRAARRACRVVWRRRRRARC